MLISITTNINQLIHRLRYQLNSINDYDTDVSTMNVNNTTRWHSFNNNIWLELAHDIIEMEKHSF